MLTPFYTFCRYNFSISSMTSRSFFTSSCQVIHLILIHTINFPSKLKTNWNTSISFVPWLKNDGLPKSYEMFSIKYYVNKSKLSFKNPKVDVVNEVPVLNIFNNNWCSSIKIFKIYKGKHEINITYSEQSSICDVVY